MGESAGNANYIPLLTPQRNAHTCRDFPGIYQFLVSPFTSAMVILWIISAFYFLVQAFSLFLLFFFFSLPDIYLSPDVGVSLKVHTTCKRRMAEIPWNVSIGLSVQLYIYFPTIEYP